MAPAGAISPTNIQPQEYSWGDLFFRPRGAIAHYCNIISGRQAIALSLLIPACFYLAVFGAPSIAERTLVGSYGDSRLVLFLGCIFEYLALQLALFPFLLGGLRLFGSPISIKNYYAALTFLGLPLCITALPGLACIIFAALDAQIELGFAIFTYYVFTLLGVCESSVMWLYGFPQATGVSTLKRSIGSMFLSVALIALGVAAVLFAGGLTFLRARL